MPLSIDSEKWSHALFLNYTLSKLITFFSCWIIRNIVEEKHRFATNYAFFIKRSSCLQRRSSISFSLAQKLLLISESSVNKPEGND